MVSFVVPTFSILLSLINTDGPASQDRYSIAPNSPLRSLELPLPESRQRESLIGEKAQASEQHHETDTLNPYERRVRRKTREDRYEYKAAGYPSQQSRHQKDKRQRPRRFGKQTLDDAFHASCVARERLTVGVSQHPTFMNPWSNFNDSCNQTQPWVSSIRARPRLQSSFVVVSVLVSSPCES